MADDPIPTAPSAAVLCPMPVIHRTWSDEQDRYVYEILPCEEHLAVRHEHHDEIYTDGIYEGGDWWTVGCHAGHVLVVPYTDGDEPPAVGEVAPEIQAALVALGVTDVHPELDPLTCTVCHGPMVLDVDTDRYYCDTEACAEYGAQATVDDKPHTRDVLRGRG